MPLRPGSPRPQAREGAGLRADEIIVDLEDSVPPDLKAEARGAVAEALAAEGWALALDQRQGERPGDTVARGRPAGDRRQAGGSPR